MKLIDLAAAILVRNQRCPTPEIAKEAILQSFKTDFPYWSYSDWNSDMPMAAGKAIMKIYESDSNTTINQLILDLPGMVESLRTSITNDASSTEMTKAIRWPVTGSPVVPPMSCLNGINPGSACA